MPFYEYIAIGLMVVFILALFTGYPVAWLLAGLSLLFATIGITLAINNGQGLMRATMDLLLR